MLGYMDLVVDFASYLAAKEVIEGMCPSCVPLAVQLPAAHGSVGVDSDLAAKKEQEECRGQCLGLTSATAHRVPAAESAPKVEFDTSIKLALIHI